MTEELNLSGFEKVVRVENSVTKTPLVSVCVQTYNHEKYIAQCLDGILMQKTSFEFEILLGEDKSEDQTREICLQYAEKYPDKIRLFLHDRSNVIYVNDKPTGRFNFLHNLANANGFFFALCEGDDYWTDNQKLQKQVTFLQRNTSFSAVSHNVFRFSPKVDKFENDSKLNYTSDSILKSEDLIKDCYLYTCSLLFKKSAISKIPPWYTKIFGADHALIILISFNGPIMVFKEVMATMNVLDSGATRNILNKNKLVAWQNYSYLLKQLNKESAFKFDYLFSERINEIDSLCSIARRKIKLLYIVKHHFRYNKPFDIIELKNLISFFLLQKGN